MPHADLEFDTLIEAWREFPSVNIYPSFSQTLDSIKHNLKSMEDTPITYITGEVVKGF